MALIKKNRLPPLFRRPKLFKKRLTSKIWGKRKAQVDGSGGNLDELAGDFARMTLDAPINEQSRVYALSAEDFSTWAIEFQNLLSSKTGPRPPEFSVLRDERTWRVSLQVCKRKETRDRLQWESQELVDSFTASMQKHMNWAKTVMVQMEKSTIQLAKSTSLRPSGPLRFLDFPAEIRNKIYACLFVALTGRVVVQSQSVDDIGLQPVDGKAPASRSSCTFRYGMPHPTAVKSSFEIVPLRNGVNTGLQTSLLRTSRQIYAEAMSVLYAQPFEVRQATGHVGRLTRLILEAALCRTQLPASPFSTKRGILNFPLRHYSIRHLRFRIPWRALGEAMQSLPAFVLKMVEALVGAFPNLVSITLALPRKQRLAFLSQNKPPIVLQYPWVRLYDCVPEAKKKEVGEEKILIFAIAKSLIKHMKLHNADVNLKERFYQLKDMVRLEVEDAQISDNVVNGAWQTVLKALVDGI